jgi:hypothetical protein
MVRRISGQLSRHYLLQTRLLASQPLEVFAVAGQPFMKILEGRFRILGSIAYLLCDTHKIIEIGDELFGRLDLTYGDDDVSSPRHGGLTTWRGQGSGPV